MGVPGGLWGAWTIKLWAVGCPDGDLNAGGTRSGPKDSKNIQHLGSVLDGVRDMAPSMDGVKLELDLH